MQKDMRRQGYFCLCLFLMCFSFFFLYVHKVILVTTMLDQFSLTAMAVNYTRAQTQHDPLTSQKRFKMIKDTCSVVALSFCWNDLIHNQLIIRCNFHVNLRSHKDATFYTIENRCKCRGMVCFQGILAIFPTQSETNMTVLCYLFLRLLKVVWNPME